MNANRRLQERKQPERVVFCKLGGEESSLVLDLSEDGLRFESLTPIEEKGSLQLRLSVDVDSAIEATGELAWIDPAKRTGGLRFLDLSAPAREQIRTWLSETSAADGERNSRGSQQNLDRQADDRAATQELAILEERRVPSLQLAPIERQREETRVSSTQLVPIERHRAQTRAQFLLGVLVGFGICTLAMIPIFRRYAGAQYTDGLKPGSLARRIANANGAAQSSGEQTQASIAQPASASASVSEPTAMKPMAAKPAVVQTVFAAAPTGSWEKQSPQTAGAPFTGGARSTNRVARAPSPPARPQPAKVERPLGASAVESGPATSKVHSSLGQVQNVKTASATPEQLWSALRAGNIKAAVALADLYARGEGVPVNCEQARVLLLAASEKNIAEASKKLQALNKGGCPANQE